jgi:hypothetical protein
MSSNPSTEKRKRRKLSINPVGLSCFEFTELCFFSQKCFTPTKVDQNVEKEAAIFSCLREPLSLLAVQTGLDLLV